MPQIRPRQVLPLAALKFGAATSDRVDTGSNTSIDDLPANPFSALVLAYPTTLTSLRNMLFKGSSATAKWQMALSGTAGNVTIVIGHATTNLTYTTSDTPFAKLAGWYWFGITVDLSLGAGLRAVIYTGKLGGNLIPDALTVTEPVGARGSDATGNLLIGCGSPNSTAFQGSIAFAAIWTRALTFGEFSALTKGATGAGWRKSNTVALWRPGWQSNGGTVVHGESGNSNAGTITGAVQSGVRVSL